MKLTYFKDSEAEQFLMNAKLDRLKEETLCVIKQFCNEFRRSK